MPTITLEKKDIINLVGRKLSDDELRERIPMLGTDLESVNEDSIIIEIFPNRPDMLSVEGFARALSSFLGINTGLRNYKTTPTENRVIVDPSVNDVRPFIKCAILKNVSLTDSAIKSLMQLQEKLHMTHGRKRRKVAIGVHDLDTISFPLYYKSVRPNDISFIPLGMSQPLTLKEILTKHPKGRGYAFILEGKTHYPIITDSKNDVISFPPIINGTMTQVTKKTKNLFIDVTGTNEYAVSTALNILVTSLADRGAEIFSLVVNDAPSPDLSPRKMNIDLSYVNKILGISLSHQQFVDLLYRMGYGYSNNSVLIPPYRADILHPIDIVEDIAIAYGYENFKPIIPKIATIAEEDSFEVFKNRVAELLVGLGLIEASTYHITNSENLTKKMNYNCPFIELSNALTNEYNVLRSWLLPSLMNVLRTNKTRAFPQKIFEMGIVFNEDPETETGVRETTKLSIVSSHAKATFTEVKQFFDYLTRMLGMPSYEIEKIDHPSFIKGRVGKAIIDNNEIGYFGEISPEVIGNWELEMPIAALEIDLSSLYHILETKN